MRRIATGIILSLFLFITGLLLAQESDSQTIVDEYTQGRAYAYLRQISVEPLYYKLHIVFPDTEIVLPVRDEHYTTDYSISPDGTQVVYTVQTASGDDLPPEIIDLQTGIIRNPGTLITSDYIHVEWSPDSTEIAFFDYYEFFLFDVEDNSLSTFVLSYEPYHAERSAAQYHSTDYSIRAYYEITWRTEHTAIASIGALQYSGWQFQQQFLVDTETGDIFHYAVPGRTHLPPNIPRTVTILRFCHR